MVVSRGGNMKKLVFRLFLLFILVINIIVIYLFLNPNKTFEQVFKFNEEYTKVKEGNFRIYTPPNLPFHSEDVLKELVQTREIAQSLLPMDYASHHSIPIFVTLSDYRGHEKIPWLSGAYFNNMETILINGEAEQYTSYTILHEYSHYLFDLYLRNQELSIEEIPAWFTEGLAEYSAFGVQNTLIVQSSYYYDVFPFEQLHNNIWSNSNTIYLQGFYAIYDLIEKHGEEVIPEILATYKQSRDFVKAFEEVTKQEYSTYHELFRLNKNHLQMLEENLNEPERILKLGEEWLSKKSTINPYSPFVLPYVITASIELHNVNDAKSYFQQLDQLLFIPNDYLYYAQAFADAGEVAFSKQLIEKGRQYAVKYHYDLDVFEAEVRKVQLDL